MYIDLKNALREFVLHNVFCGEENNEYQQCNITELLGVAQTPRAWGNYGSDRQIFFSVQVLLSFMVCLQARA